MNCAPAGGVIGRSITRRRLFAGRENSRLRENMAGCGQSTRRSPPSRRHTTSA